MLLNIIIYDVKQFRVKLFTFARKTLSELLQFIKNRATSGIDSADRLKAVAAGDQDSNGIKNGIGKKHFD